jgi:uncharacterized membrane protein
MSDDDAKTEVEGAAVSSRLFSLIILGIILVFVGVAVMVVASALSGSSSVGGVILIGPIPIVFGAGPDAAWLIALSVVLTIISLVLFLVLNRMVKRIEWACLLFGGLFFFAVVSVQENQC